MSQVFSYNVSHQAIKDQVLKIKSTRSLSINTAARISHAIQSPDDYLCAFASRFPNALIDDLIQPHDHHDKTNLYYSSNVCFVKKESHSSTSQRYSEPKRNTYTLCPLCDPWKNCSQQIVTKTKYRNGDKVIIDPRHPQFYDTLHSEFDHHMNQVHGVYKSGDLALDPFIGLSLTKLTQSSKSDDYKLSCICPYPHRGTLEPCLSEFCFNTNDKDCNPFKSYLRHVCKYHFAADLKKQDTTGLKYKPVVLLNDRFHYNKFIPLNSFQFYNTMSILQKTCQNSSLWPIDVCEDEAIFTTIKNTLQSIGDVTPVWTPTSSTRSSSASRSPTSNIQSIQTTPDTTPELNIITNSVNDNLARDVGQTCCLSNLQISNNEKVEESQSISPRDEFLYVTLCELSEVDQVSLQTPLEEPATIVQSTNNKRQFDEVEQDDSMNEVKKQKMESFNAESTLSIEDVFADFNSFVAENPLIIEGQQIKEDQKETQKQQTETVKQNETSQLTDINQQLCQMKDIEEFDINSFINFDIETQSNADQDSLSDGELMKKMDSLIDQLPSLL